MPASKPRTTDMADQKPRKKSDIDTTQRPDDTCITKPLSSHKRKNDEGVEENGSTRKRNRTIQETVADNKTYARQKAVAQDVDHESEDDSNDDVGSDVSNTSTTTKKKKSLATPQFAKLLEIEDKSQLCIIGDNEANIFPKKLNFMNHKIDVVYDSRVHVWLKADEFAKALGYKNYKSAIERFVHPSFVRTFPEVLDMSRTRYGDAYRLYPVNSRVLFINEAGMMQLLLRSMLTNSDTVTKDETIKSDISNATDRAQQEGAVGACRTGRPQPKPKLSADWINYQILPSLIAFSEAAKNGITAQEERRLQSMNQLYNQ